jgi:lipoprotein NlpD
MPGPRRRNPCDPCCLLLLPVLVLAGCADAFRWDAPPAPAPVAVPPAGGTAARPAEHVVRGGETLYAIARRYGVGPADLARWNGLGTGSLIRPGQRLRLGPGMPVAGNAPAPLPAGPAPPWRWPAAGPVVAGFGANPAAATGILVAGAVGDPVQVAADGLVVYAGDSLPGYGELLIVKHDDTWLTAYGHNSALLVGEGARVRRGDTIARLGLGPGRRPLLHFEIRRNGDPVDPLAVLPPR